MIFRILTAVARDSDDTNNISSFLFFIITLSNLIRRFTWILAVVVGYSNGVKNNSAILLFFLTIFLKIQRFPLILTVSAGILTGANNDSTFLMFFLTRFLKIQRPTLILTFSAGLLPADLPSFSLISTVITPLSISLILPIRVTPQLLLKQFLGVTGADTL